MSIDTDEERGCIRAWTSEAGLDVLQTMLDPERRWATAGASLFVFDGGEAEVG